MLEKISDHIGAFQETLTTADGKNVVLIVGDSGAGKSTIINYLVKNCIMRRELNTKGQTVVVPVDPSKVIAPMADSPTDFNSVTTHAMVILKKILLYVIMVDFMIIEGKMQEFAFLSVPK